MDFTGKVMCTQKSKGNEGAGNTDNWLVNTSGQGKTSVQQDWSGQHQSSSVLVGVVRAEGGMGGLLGLRWRGKAVVRGGARSCRPL